MQRSAAKILVLAPIPADALAPLRKRFELVDASGSPLYFLRNCPKPEHFEIAFTIGNCPLTREMIGLLPALRYVCHYGVGTDQLALNALRERDVLVTNTAGASASCVADLALALLLSTIRQLPQGDAFVRGGRWRETPFPCGPSIGGRRIGVYGLGDIGSRIAARLAPFETEIGYHTRSLRDDVPYRHFPSLLALSEWADDLIIAVSATEQTVGSVNRAVLAALGSEGVLINVARGSVVDEHALLDALSSGALAGAGLDTFIGEPAINDAFLGLKNVVLSPHIGGGTRRAIKRTTQIFLSNLERFLAGEPPRNVVG